MVSQHEALIKPDNAFVNGIGRAYQPSPSTTPNLTTLGGTGSSVAMTSVTLAPTSAITSLTFTTDTPTTTALTHITPTAANITSPTITTDITAPTIIAANTTTVTTIIPSVNNTVTTIIPITLTSITTFTTISITTAIATLSPSHHPSTISTTSNTPTLPMSTTSVPPTPTTPASPASAPATPTSNTLIPATSAGITSSVTSNSSSLNFTSAAKKTSTPAIAGSVVGGVALLVAFIILVLWKKRRVTRNRNKINPSSTGDSAAPPATESTPSPEAPLLSISERRPSRSTTLQLSFPPSLKYRAGRQSLERQADQAQTPPSSISLQTLPVQRWKFPIITQHQMEPRQQVQEMHELIKQLELTPVASINGADSVGSSEIQRRISASAQENA